MFTLESLAGILGLEGPEMGEVGPELDDSDRATRDGRDSEWVLEADDENRTEETRGDARAVVIIGEEGVMLLTGREEGGV